MELESRIQKIADKVIPIYRVGYPGRPADCRHKQLYKEHRQALLKALIREEVLRLIQDHKEDSPMVITALIDNYFNHYFENHHHQ